VSLCDARCSLWHGTVFSIIFQPDDVVLANSAEVCVRAMVLLVEDDVDSRAIYGTVLRHSGFLVVEADDGESAVESVRRHRPDLVVMDAGLPGMDGWDATAALKGDPETASVPILVLTVHSQPADLERAEAAGCDAYVIKPMDPASLAETVGRMIAETRVAGARDNAGGRHAVGPHTGG
jgi:CheY-like chemotaxis protein